MKPRCTLHPDATETCPCCKTDITVRDLNYPMTMALWQCVNNHQEIAAPFLDAERSRCVRCGELLEFITSGVWTPR